MRYGRVVGLDGVVLRYCRSCPKPAAHGQWSARRPADERSRREVAYSAVQGGPITTERSRQERARRAPPSSASGTFAQVRRLWQMPSRVFCRKRVSAGLRVAVKGVTFPCAVLDASN